MQVYQKIIELSEKAYIYTKIPNWFNTFNTFIVYIFITFSFYILYFISYILFYILCDMDM